MSAPIIVERNGRREIALEHGALVQIGKGATVWSVVYASWSGVTVHSGSTSRSFFIDGEGADSVERLRRVDTTTSDELELCAHQYDGQGCTKLVGHDDARHETALGFWWIAS